MGGGVYARALQRAAEMLGGKAELRQFLRVSMRELELWLAGKEKPPMDVFLKAVDVISGAPIADKAQHSRGARAKAAPTRERAEAIQKAILKRGLLHLHEPTPISALAFLKQKYEPAEGAEMVQAALDAAINAAGADKGDMQLARPEGLRIVAQRGFGQPFLEFFAIVDARSASACALALKTARRVVVSDVASDILFASTSAGEVLAEAGVRALQSTPLCADSGNVLGVLSTHWGSPRGLTEPQAEALDRIATRTAFWLEGGAL
jgi:hypothetical protein